MSGERKRILWVEDSARFDLAKIVGPIYRARRFHLSLAEDATSAVRMLSSNTFDVVIMDIRIPPGEDEFWIKRYQDNGSDASQAKLGLLVLRWLFDKSWEYRADLPQTGQHRAVCGFFSRTRKRDRRRPQEAWDCYIPGKSPRQWQ